jgi:hypothetical protein
MRDYERKVKDLHVSHHIHWVVWGTGTPKDRGEVKSLKIWRG